MTLVLLSHEICTDYGFYENMIQRIWCTNIEIQ